MSDINSKLIEIGFHEGPPLETYTIRSLRGEIGIYFIYLSELRIPYPRRASRLIYIGMSESRQNSIGNRLRDHKSGQSGNKGLANYLREYKAFFNHHTGEFLSVLGKFSIVEFETLFLESFLQQHGSYPICNNQSGIVVEGSGLSPNAIIDWKCFT